MAAKFLAGLILLATLLSACARPAATTPTPGKVAATVAQPTPTIASPTNTTAPTEPPTATPTLKPPTAAPAAAKWQSSQAVEAFKAAGLEAESPRPLTKDDYGLAPMVATEGTRFLIPSLGPDSGGRIFSFASQDDLARTQDYYVEMGKSSAIFFSWTFAKDNILVQINGDLPEETAKKYEAVLAAMEKIDS